MQESKWVTLQLPKKTSFYQEKAEEMTSLKALSETMGYGVDRSTLDFYLTKVGHSSIVFPQNSSLININIRGSDVSTKLMETLDATIKLAALLKLGFPRINPADVGIDTLDFYAQQLEASFPEESKEHVQEIRAFLKDVAEIEDGFVELNIDDKGKEEEVHAAAPDAQPSSPKFKFPHEHLQEWIAEKKAASHNTKVAKLMTGFVPLKGNNEVETDIEEGMVKVDRVIDGSEHSDTITLHLSSKKDGSSPSSSDDEGATKSSLFSRFMKNSK